MKNKTVTEIKQFLDSDTLSEEQLSTLQHDSRKGVQKLLQLFYQKQQKNQELEHHFIKMCEFEQKNYTRGCEFIAGIDEAGRGPLAGPVVAAAVILPQNFKLLGLDDSKQLNAAKRHDFFQVIKAQAVSYGIAAISNEKIDQVNIYQATKQAMSKALNQLDPIPDHTLIDAVPLNGLPCSSESIIKGDQKSISIAAASILAKVTRDTIMKKIHDDYPFYDFASNMGYGTKHHMQALQEHGISPFHRKSFAPIRSTIIQ